jgi:nickel-dependent lactate racemase/HD superfamily phosphodiesterase
MQYKLKYGKTVIDLDFPESASILSHVEKASEQNNDEAAIIHRALAAPIDSLPLEKVVRKGEKTCIVVPDSTRVCRAAIFLPILIEKLNACGIEDHDILILMANGSHRKNTPEEQIEILGEAIVNRIRIIEHDCQDSTMMVHLGETAKKTPVFVNRYLIRSERVILAGGVLHHYFAGFGGGPKLVVPGCAGYETILKNHRFTIHPEFQALHPACEEGNMDDNPVHADIRDALKFVTVDFTLNVVLDSHGFICNAFAGELFAAHQKACEVVHQLHSIPFQQKANLVIASAGGYPKDVNLIQVHKTIHHAFQVVAKNGVLIIAAECADGIGSKTFMEWFDNDPDLATMHQNLLNNFKINGNTALALKMKTEQVKILLLSKLPSEIVKKLGMIPVNSITEALEIARTQLPSDYQTTIIPDTATFLPILRRDLLNFSPAEQQNFIQEAFDFVQHHLGSDISGHDWFHAWRVWRLAQRIAEKEGGNLFVIQLAAILHDVVDWKNIDPALAYQKDRGKDWLRLKKLPGELIDHVSEIIEKLSYKGAGVKTEMRTLEGKIVQDADRLDAMGAIGIARTFAYGALKNQPIYDPEKQPVLHQSATDYQARQSTGINHFYEKLLLLQERLNTPTAQIIGNQRHQFLENFLKRFKDEWEGVDEEMLNS